MVDVEPGYASLVWFNISWCWTSYNQKDVTVVCGLFQRCTFCKQKGATIGCVVGACRKVFHFGCGKAGGTLHQYYDSYRYTIYHRCDHVRIRFMASKIHWSEVQEHWFSRNSPVNFSLTVVRSLAEIWNSVSNVSKQAIFTIKFKQPNYISVTLI